MRNIKPLKAFSLPQIYKLHSLAKGSGSPHCVRAVTILMATLQDPNFISDEGIVIRQFLFLNSMENILFFSLSLSLQHSFLLEATSTVLPVTAITVLQLFHIPRGQSWAQLRTTVLIQSRSMDTSKDNVHVSYINMGIVARDTHIFL